MSRRSASRAGTARVAVVGSTSAEGALVSAALAERGVAGKQVDLYGVTRGEAILSEYDGEARLVQNPEPSEVAGHEVVFLCETGEASSELLSLAGPRSIVLDLVGCATAAVPVVHAELRPPSPTERGGPLRVPHSISVVLGELLKPIEDAYGVVSATAFVLRPAADFGQEGVEELRDQTVGLLRFEKPPASVFGRQLAFNVIPQHLIPGGGEALVRRVEGEVADLLRWNERRLAIQLAAVPVFYGHTAAVRLRLREEASLPQVTAALAHHTPGPRPVGKGAPGTPMEAAAGPAATLAHVTEDAAFGFWVWLIAGEAGAASARAAVDLAASLAEI